MDPSILPELMSYQFPLLEEKLVKEHMAADREEVRRLLDELKKYLYLTRDRTRNVPMFSRRIDETWHQFVLFTKEYRAFSDRFFKEYVHHTPNSVRARPDQPLPPEITFEQFRAEYEPRFGPISDAWRDELAVDVDTRVIRATFGKPLIVRVEAGSAELVWTCEPPKILIRTQARAEAALRFLIANDHFYVRELPGLPGPDQVTICRQLLKGRRFMRVAP